MLILYLCLYICPLLCDFKGLPTKRQNLFLCLLFDYKFVHVTCFGLGDVWSHDTESGKSTWVLLVVLFYFFHCLENIPGLASWGIRDTCSVPFVPIPPAKASLDQPTANSQLTSRHVSKPGQVQNNCLIYSLDCITDPQTCHFNNCMVIA